MKRYSPDRDGAMDEYEDGEYVRYSQANAQLQLKNETIESLQRQLDVTREALNAANNALAKVIAERDHLREML